jgi:hypothetical protein
MRNNIKLRFIYAALSNQLDAARLIALGNSGGEGWDVNAQQMLLKKEMEKQVLQQYSDAQSYGGSMGGGGVLNGSTSSGGAVGPSLASDNSITGDVLINGRISGQTLDSAYLESIQLMRRIRAFQIPPLPPDLGSLQQPDERKFRCVYAFWQL